MQPRRPPPVGIYGLYNDKRRKKGSTATDYWSAAVLPTFSRGRPLLVTASLEHYDLRIGEVTPLTAREILLG